MQREGSLSYLVKELVVNDVPGRPRVHPLYQLACAVAAEVVLDPGPNQEQVELALGYLTGCADSRGNRYQEDTVY